MKRTRTEEGTGEDGEAPDPKVTLTAEEPTAAKRVKTYPEDGHAGLLLLELPDVALGVLIGEWLGVKSAMALRATSTAALALVERHQPLVCLLLKDLAPAVRDVNFWTIPVSEKEVSPDDEREKDQSAAKIYFAADDIFDRYALASAVDHFLRREEEADEEDSIEEADPGVDEAQPEQTEQQEAVEEESTEQEKQEEGEGKDEEDEDEDEEDEVKKAFHQEFVESDVEEPDEEEDAELEEGEMEEVCKEGRDFIDNFSLPDQPTDQTSPKEPIESDSPREKLLQRIDALSNAIAAALRQREIEDPSFLDSITGLETWGIAQLKRRSEFMRFFQRIRVRYWMASPEKMIQRKECLLEVLPQQGSAHQSQTLVYMTGSQFYPSEDDSRGSIHMYIYNPASEKWSRIFVYLHQTASYWISEELNQLTTDLGLHDLKLAVLYTLLHCGGCLPKGEDDASYGSLESLAAAELDEDAPSMEWTIEKPPSIHSEYINRQVQITIDHSSTRDLLHIKAGLARLRFRVELVRTLNLVSLYDWLDYDDICRMVPHIVWGEAQSLGMSHWYGEQAVSADGTIRLTLPNASEGEFLVAKCSLEALMTIDDLYTAFLQIRASTPDLASRLGLSFPESNPVYSVDVSNSWAFPEPTISVDVLRALATEFGIPYRPISLGTEYHSLEEHQAVQMAALLSVCTIAAAPSHITTIIPKQTLQRLACRTVHPAQAALSLVFDMNPPQEEGSYGYFMPVSPDSPREADDDGVDENVEPVDDAEDVSLSQEGLDGAGDE